MDWDGVESIFKPEGATQSFQPWIAGDSHVASLGEDSAKRQEDRIKVLMNSDASQIYSICQAK